MSKDAEAQVRKRRYSRLAIASLLLAASAFLCLFVQEVVVYPGSIRALFWKIMAVPGICGLLAGVAAIERIARSKWQLKGFGFAILGIVLAASISHIWLLEKIRPRSTASASICGANLKGLGTAMAAYAAENDGSYPPPEQWCGVLMEHCRVTERSFVCQSLVVRGPFGLGGTLRWPKPKKGNCTYAMNPNCKPDSPPDTVLLFDSPLGWNQFGGPELSYPKRHQGKGCNIAFRNLEVRFVRPNGFAQLKWNAEEK